MKATISKRAEFTETQKPLPGVRMPYVAGTACCAKFTVDGHEFRSWLPGSAEECAAINAVVERIAHLVA